MHAALQNDIARSFNFRFRAQRVSPSDRLS